MKNIGKLNTKRDVNSMSRVPLPDCLKLSYISSVFARVLPSFRSNKSQSYYSSLLSDKYVIDYFKRYYRFVELPGLRPILERSKYYNKEFMDKVGSQVAESNDLFIARLTESANTFSSDKICRITQNDILFIFDMLFAQVLRFNNPVDIDTWSLRPNIDEVISQQNLKASVGIPKPWVKKREVVSTMRDFLTGFYQRTLKPTMLHEFIQPFSAAFRRGQVTNSGYKVRLVFAVDHLTVVLESVFDMTFKRLLKKIGPTSNFVHGFTQPEISRKCSYYSDRHVYSCDVSKFDESIPSIILVLAFSLMEYCLNMLPYQTRIFRFLRNNFITLPVFHPSLPLKSRYKGITSGSGFTSSIGSFVMFTIHCLTFRRYCKQKNIPIRTDQVEIIVSSDDSFLASKFPLNMRLYAAIMKRDFGINLEVEASSEPGQDVVFFLGSTWKNGLPFRNINRLLARILYGSGNIPSGLPPIVLFCSRSFEILGNVSNFSEIFSTFNIKKFPKRVFRFYELMDYTTRISLESKNFKDPRGRWVSLEIDDLSKLDKIWLTR